MKTGVHIVLRSQGIKPKGLILVKEQAQNRAKVAKSRTLHRLGLKKRNKSSFFVLQLVTTMYNF